MFIRKKKRETYEAERDPAAFAIKIPSRWCTRARARNSSRTSALERCAHRLLNNTLICFMGKYRANSALYYPLRLSYKRGKAA